MLNAFQNLATKKTRFLICRNPYPLSQCERSITKKIASHFVKWFRPLINPRLGQIEWIKELEQYYKNLEKKSPSSHSNHYHWRYYWHCPNTAQRIRKIITVLIRPPPSHFAPAPASKPLKRLFIFFYDWIRKYCAQR